MKKMISILVAIPLLIGLFVFSQYHLTLEGAWSELEREWKGRIIAPYSEDAMAILIDKKGNLYVGMAFHTDIWVFYHDFIIYPTKLNIHDFPKENEYYYSKVQGYGANYEMHLGMVTNSKVRATLNNPIQKVTKKLVFLGNYVLKNQVKDIKIIYINSSLESIGKLNFIDDKYNSIPLTPINKDNN